MSDFQARREEVLAESAAEKGDDVLRMDWTKKAATRCSAEYMFNVMSGSQRIVASIPASSAGPYEMEDLLWQMRCCKTYMFYHRKCDACYALCGNVGAGATLPKHRACRRGLLTKVWDTFA